MKTIKRSIMATTLAVCILFQVACGPNLIAGFKAGFAATKPFVQTLVSQGVISQAKADAAIADVDSSLDFASTAQACLSGASDKPAKAQCYLTLANNLRTVLERHNIGGSPQLDRIATIAEAAILAFQNYFNRVVPRPGVRASSKVDPDAQLKADLEAVRADLKALTGK